jgi:glutamate--cysteine ligase
MNGALKGEVSDPVPNMGDWTNHLSTLFPEVRLKRFLEMRGADGGPWRRICALPAYWVGLLYDDEALSAAEDLTKDWTYEEVLALRNDVPAKALKASFRGKPVAQIARKTLEISRLGLLNRKQLNGDGFDETHFLAPLEEIVAAGITDAERMLKAYNSVWAGSVEPIFLEYAY